jgi:hypothetical protein
MAPELQKLRSPATARLLDQFANLWLLITVGAVLLSLLLSGSRAQDLATAWAALQTAAASRWAFWALLVAPGIGLKVWARRQRPAD